MKERRHNIKTLFSTFDDKICTLISIIWAKYFSSGEGGGSVLRCTQPKYGQRKTEKYILCIVILTMPLKTCRLFQNTWY